MVLQPSWKADEAFQQHLEKEMPEVKNSVKPKPSPGKGRGKKHYEENEWKIIAQEFADASSTAKKNDVAAKYNSSYQTIRKRAEALNMMESPKPRGKKPAAKVVSVVPSAPSVPATHYDDDGYHPSPKPVAAKKSSTLSGDEKSELATYRMLVGKLTPFEIIEIMNR